MTTDCSNVTWAANNGETVEWARGMWTCLDDCDECRNWAPGADRMTTDLSNLRTVVIDGTTWLFADRAPDYFVDTDASGETHLWRGYRDDLAPKIALSKDGPTAADPVVWALAVAALTDRGADS